MPANPRRVRRMFWALLPAVAGFVVIMANARVNDPVRTGTALLIEGSLGTALLMLLLVLWDADRFRWAGRALAALIFVAYGAYAIAERQGIFGLVLLGAPALWYACTGRFSLRKTELHRWQATWDAREAALTDLFGPPRP